MERASWCHHPWIRRHCRHSPLPDPPHLPAAWRPAAPQVALDEAAVRGLEAQLAALRKETDGLNRERKLQQHAAGEPRWQREGGRMREGGREGGCRREGRGRRRGKRCRS